MTRIEYRPVPCGRPGRSEPVVDRLGSMTSSTASGMIVVGDHGVRKVMTESANIAADEFEARCLELLDEVAETGEIFIITRRGKPIARLAPVADGSLPFGALAGSVVAEDDVVSPVGEAWDTDS